MEVRKVHLRSIPFPYKANTLMGEVYERLPLGSALAQTGHPLESALAYYER